MVDFCSRFLRFSNFAGLSPDSGLLFSWVMASLGVIFCYIVADCGNTIFGVLDGFHEISVLTSVVVLSLSGIIINIQFLNARVTSIEVHF